MDTAHASGALPGILRLTPEIRRRIYWYLSVGRRSVYGTAVPVKYDLGDRDSFKARNATAEFDSGPATFHSLLRSCRTIYSEASAELYSTNWFVIFYQPHQSLRSLRALTPHALASLRNIKIVLNQASCHRRDLEHGYWPCCNRRWTYMQANSPNGSPILRRDCSDCDHDDGDDHDRPLIGGRKRARRIVEEWQQTAAYLASHIVPGKLELSLVCDVGHTEVEVAGRVLDGVRLLPPLKDCHIRLCETRHPQLQQLAQEAVLHARGFAKPKPQRLSPSSSGPSLLTLPAEIQLLILQYTDLVTPGKEVMWERLSPGRGYYIQRSRCNYNWPTDFPCEPECRQSCLFIECWRTPFPQPSIGCFCRARHTVVSSRCRCWAPPTPLFLVCRALYAEANVVFYRENRFIVADSPPGDPFSCRPLGDYPHDFFAASYFLRKVVPTHCLQYLRFLEIVFSPIHYNRRMRDDHPAFRDWTKTVIWAKDKLNLPVLTLRLIVAPQLDPVGGLLQPEGLTRGPVKEVLKTYRRIYAPLRRLGRAEGGGLARFYAKLSSPWAWAHEVQRWWETMDIEALAEKHVMGERYEPVSAAGPKPLMSAWWAGASDFL